MKTLWYGAITGLVLASAVLCPHAHAASIDYFPNLCSDLRNGMPLADIETLLLARGYSDGDAGTFTGHMIVDHCPDVIPAVREQLR